MFDEEDYWKLVEFCKDNELLYKRLMDYIDPNKREVVWDKFCNENKMDNAACKRRFQNQRTMYSNEVLAGSTQIFHHHSSKSEYKQYSNAGPSEESDQPSFGESSTIEAISVSIAHGSTEEPLRLSGVSLSPSQNPFITQPCATPIPDRGPGKVEEIRGT